MIISSGQLQFGEDLQMTHLFTVMKVILTKIFLRQLRVSEDHRSIMFTVSFANGCDRKNICILSFWQYSRSDVSML